MRSTRPFAAWQLPSADQPLFIRRLLAEDLAKGFVRIGSDALVNTRQLGVERALKRETDRFVPIVRPKHLRRSCEGSIPHYH